MMTGARGRLRTFEDYVRFVDKLAERPSGREILEGTTDEYATWEIFEGDVVTCIEEMGFSYVLFGNLVQLGYEGVERDSERNLLHTAIAKMAKRSPYYG